MQNGSNGPRDINGHDTKLRSAETVGAYLRQMRLQRNIGLEEVSGDTGITVSVLEALENEDREQLPAEVYVKAFYKKYAEYLGLNPEEIDAKYRQQAPNPGKRDNRASFNTVITLKGQEDNVFAEMLRRSFLPLAILVLGILLYLIYKNYLTPYIPLGFYGENLQPFCSFTPKNYFTFFC